MSQHKLSPSQILDNLKIANLNDMQQAALENIPQDKDVILLSPTGSGKTLAFLLPLCLHLDQKIKGTQLLIVVPSRELAQQIEKVFKSMGTGIKITSCYGGHKREIEENNLIESPSIIVGTPGRLGDHIRRENITVDTIHTVVLDEFDKSLELGFLDEMAFIMESLPVLEKRILTSATATEDIPEFVGLNDPITLDFSDAVNERSAGLDIKVLHSSDKDKADTVFNLLCYTGERSAIVFCNHRESVERLSAILKERGIMNEFYHGAMEQQQRDAALTKFRNGSTYVLVTTDLAARGLDIPNIRYIIHYHLPLTPDSYTHRNGRTARMDASGTAILILSPEETIPEYIIDPVEEIVLPEKLTLPEKPKWTTLFVAAGKKDKVNKIDIVGFLSHKGELKKEDIGLVDVKDFFSFVAIRKSKASNALHLIKDEKLKGRRIKIAVAK
jgi:superfamily II DNA/RNA helicase